MNTEAEIRALKRRIDALEKAVAWRDKLGRPAKGREIVKEEAKKRLPMDGQKFIRACMRRGVSAATVHRARAALGIVAEDGIWAWKKKSSRKRAS